MKSRGSGGDEVFQRPCGTWALEMMKDTFCLEEDSERPAVEVYVELDENSNS